MAADRIAEIEALVATLERSSDDAARLTAKRLLATVLDWHGSAVRVLTSAVPPAELSRICAHDEALRSVLDLHGIEVRGQEPRKVSLPLAAEHRCDVCSVRIDTEHAHVVESASGRLVCVCPVCATARAASAGYVPLDRPARRIAPLPEETWESLDLPVRLAFLSPRGDAAIARYPGPGGAIEATITKEAWARVVGPDPELRALRPDVDALLVNRIGAASDHFIVSIEDCFRLVGLVRAAWRGIGGGSEKDEAIASFFDELRARAPSPGSAS